MCIRVTTLQETLNARSMMIIMKILLPHLLRSEALHVGALNDVVQIFVQIGDVGVDGDLVLPLELGPHLAELCVVARCRHNVVHYVDVYVIEHDAVSVAGGTRCVIHWQ